MRATYIGDEASAAGYRLAGIDTIVCAEGREADAFDRTLASASLVLLSSAVAARIAPARLRAAVIAMSPLVAVVPALDRSLPLPDVVARTRAEIGLAP